MLALKSLSILLLSLAVLQFVTALPASEMSGDAGSLMQLAFTDTATTGQ